MDSALYNATSGLIVQQTRLDVTANNLANVNTPGFRPDGVFVRELLRYGEADGRHTSAVNGTVLVPGTFTGKESGTPIYTGAPTDLALFGPGLFTVSTPDGLRYTRDGSLFRDDTGRLVTSHGYSLLDPEGKEIVLPRGKLDVGRDGSLKVADQPAGSLQIVEIAPADQVKTGERLVIPARAAALRPSGPDTQVRQGFRETSGVNAVSEMVQLITAQRAFESYQRVLRLVVGEVDRRAVNDIAGSV